MTNKIKIVLMLALVLGLPLLMVAPAFAEDHMTPPWGENPPQLKFGPEDKGVMQFDYKGQFRFTGRDTGSGADGTDNTTNFNFRRNRLSLMGGYGEMFSVYVQTEFTDDPNVTTLGVASTNQGSDFQLLDAVMRFDVHDSFKVSAGKFKYNLSRENLEACEEPLSLDRSLFIRSPFVTTRDYGLALWGNLFKDKFQYRADVMEGRKAVSGVTAPSSGLRYSGRAHITLLDPEKGYGYRGTYLGKKRVLTFGGSYQFEKDVTYTDTVTQLAPEDYKGWTADAFFEYPVSDTGAVTLSGAYEKIDLGDAYKGAHPDPEAIGLNGAKNGWYGKAGFLFPKVPVQLFGRYEKWRFAMLNNVYDQMVDWYAAGLNYYIWGQHLKLSGEWNRTVYDTQGTFGGPQGTALTSTNFNTFVAQIQLVF